MRVLLINKFHYRKGGAERAYFDTARILAENGHSVAFFSMRHPENLPTPWNKYFVSPVDYLDNRQSLWVKGRAAWRILWNAEAARELERLIIEFSPEVAHLHNTYHQLSPSILWMLRKHRIPMVMTLHDYKAVSPNYNLFVRGKIWPYASPWRALMDRAVKDSFLKSVVCVTEWWLHRFFGSAALVDQYIAPSRFLIEQYQRLGFPYPICYVPQPLSPFPPKPTVFGQGKYFLFAGRLSPEKGVETLLQAFTFMPDRLLRLAGTGPDEAKLKQQYATYPNITFLGHVTGTALDKIFREAKAFILPSEWYENMPYVLLEALGAGLPVIGSKLGGTLERIHEGDNGFLFEAGNVDDLKRAVERCEVADRRAIGERAWESIQDLQVETYYETLMSIYRTIISLDKKE